MYVKHKLLIKFGFTDFRIYGSILNNICKRLLLFVSPQNTLANSSGKFGVEETLTECEVFF